MNLRKHFTALALVMGIVTILPACRKCESCSYTVQDHQGNQTTKPFPEFCGQKHQRDMDREACHTMAALNGSTCVCTKN